MNELTPGELETLLYRGSTRGDAAFVQLSRALALAEPPLLQELQDYLAACARVRGRRLSNLEAGWSSEEIQALLRLLILDPGRFAREEGFRARVVARLHDGLAPEVRAKLRAPLLYRLNQLPGFDFVLSEQIESAWGGNRRSSRDREVRFAALEGLRLGNVSGPIEMSLYSLSSDFFELDEIAPFLRALRTAAPRRALVVLSDRPLLAHLAPLAQELEIEVLETYGRPFTPWPRDPFTFLHRSNGGLLVLVRPNRQEFRGDDALMGRELIQLLPERLDEAFGQVWWSLSPTPFHNGHILHARGWTWISIHSLELRILQLLELKRVPVETFSSPEGIDVYLEATYQAAEELRRLYRQPIRFVHPLPTSGAAASRSRTMQILGGGAGFDLDSVVTLVPVDDGAPAALVGDPALGASLLARLSAAELEEMRQAYGLWPVGEDLRRRLIEAQSSGRAPGLKQYLDLVAEHLETEGLRGSRLPLLLLPMPLLEPRLRTKDPDVLVGWHNVVFEQRDGALRAEAFASSLPSADRHAQEVFRSHGGVLTLLPPLIESVRRNGGYRCASNHVRPR